MEILKRGLSRAYVVSWWPRSDAADGAASRVVSSRERVIALLEEGLGTDVVRSQERIAFLGVSWNNRSQVASFLEGRSGSLALWHSGAEGRDPSIAASVSEVDVEVP